MKDKKVKKIIVKLINDLYFELTQDNKDRLLNQAINALKPKVDEGRLYSIILDFNKKSEWDELPIQLIQDLAHAIALKKDEWLK